MTRILTGGEPANGGDCRWSLPGWRAERLTDARADLDGGIEMRVLVMARRRFPVPEAELTAMFTGFAAWWKYYRGNWEGAWFFAGGAEGFGVANMPDEATFHCMMLEWPFAEYFDLEVRPVLGIDEALALWFDETRLVAAGQ